MARRCGSHGAAATDAELTNWCLHLQRTLRRARHHGESFDVRCGRKAAKNAKVLRIEKGTTDGNRQFGREVPEIGDTPEILCGFAALRVSGSRSWGELGSKTGCTPEILCGSLRLSGFAVVWNATMSFHGRFQASCAMIRRLASPGMESNEES